MYLPTITLRGGAGGLIYAWFHRLVLTEMIGWVQVYSCNELITKPSFVDEIGCIMLLCNSYLHCDVRGSSTSRYLGFKGVNVIK